MKTTNAANVNILCYAFYACTSHGTNSTNLKLNIEPGQ